VGAFLGLKLLTLVSRVGAITGFGLGPGKSGEHLLAETLLAARQQQAPRLPTAGHSLDDCYVADTGFAGKPGALAVVAHLWGAGHHPSGAEASASLAKTLAAVVGGLARDRRNRA
jgi:hypothetical protein